MIGSLCKWAQEMGHSVSIVSADKDILQCVTSKDADPVVCRITPDKGEVHFAEQVKEALGVPPEQIANWLALCGDSSDGYKPYPKLGPTGAAACDLTAITSRRMRLTLGGPGNGMGALT